MLELNLADRSQPVRKLKVSIGGLVDLIFSMKYVVTSSAWHNFVSMRYCTIESRECLECERRLGITQYEREHPYLVVVL